MFFHNLKYTIKILFQNKILIFWTFAFPIILGTLFSFAFSDIEKNETFDIIDIAIIENETFKNSTYQKTFEILGSKENKERLFKIKYTSKEKAEKLLEESKITGYFFLDKNPKVVVKSNGIYETIFKYVVEEMNVTETIMKDVMEKEIKDASIKNPNRLEDMNAFAKEIYMKVIHLIQEDANVQDISSTNLSYTMIEFYTLIAMTCLYGGILGMFAMNYCLANMTSTGKRITVSPSSKLKILLGGTVASYVIQLIGIFLLFIYTIFVLNVDYGSNLPLIILLTLVGCLAGLSLGIFISCVFKTNENVKTGIVIAVTMFGCFLSGMMGITMKYIIDKNMPIINQLNPANILYQEAKI